MPRLTIKQRADELQKKLGHGPGPVAPTPAAAPVNPNQLVTPQQFAALWAQSEAVVVTAVIDAFLESLPTLTLGSCTVVGPIVTGAPGCVAGPPLQTLPKLMAAQNLPKRAEAKKFCEKASESAAKHIGGWIRQLAPLGLSWYPTYAAAPGPVAPSLPNVPTPLADLGRSAAHMLEPIMIDLELQKAIDRPWATTYGDGKIARDVCESAAQQLSKFFKEFCANSLVQGVTAIGQVAGQPGQVGLVHGNTVPKTGFVVPVVAYRPEWVA